MSKQRDDLSDWLKGLGIGLIGIWTWIILDPYTCYTIRAYRIDHHIRSENTHIDPKPHDCDFLHAPIGDKDCDYELILQLIDRQLYVRWGKTNEENNRRPKGEYIDANGYRATWDGWKWIEHVGIEQQ